MKRVGLVLVLNLLRYVIRARMLPREILSLIECILILSFWSVFQQIHYIYCVLVGIYCQLIYVGIVVGVALNCCLPNAAFVCIFI